MKKIAIVLAALCLMSAQFSAASPEGSKLPKDVKMSKEVLKDKIRGAWAGQVIGCTYGGPTEFRYATTISNSIDIPWHEHMIKSWYDHQPALYDDIYMDLTFVDVFDKQGLDAPVSAFAEAFAGADYHLWHANLQARYNIRHGILPPESGHWLNNAHADDIDFQIEADYAGIMAPGMPNAASYYCDGIGHMMNSGDGWYGGVFIANMYALAFVSDDVEFVVTEALKSIPDGTRFKKVISDVVGWYRKYPEDWNLTWALVNRDHNFDIGCPEGVYKHYDIDAVLNSAYVAIGLLYGKKNFYRTMDIACRCGADSDCNPASAGGILGAMMGFEAIPEYWRKPVYEVEDRDFKYTTISLKKATEMSYNQALQVIERNGGKVSKDKVRIKLQSPEPVRYEQNFEGHVPVRLNAVKKPLKSIGEYNFTGNGIVMRYNFTKAAGYKDHDYSAIVEEYIDGKLVKTMDLPASGNGQTKELVYIYQLPVGPHTLTLNWINKEEDLDIIVSEAIIYSDKLNLTQHEDK